MSRLTSSVTVVAVAAATVLVGGTATADAAAPPARRTITVSASSRNVVTAPDAIRTGVTRVRVTGTHSIGIVKRKKAGPATLVKESNDQSSAASRKLLRDFTIIGVLQAPTDNFLPLGAGTYYLFDADAPRLTTSKIRTVTVSGSARNVAVPASTTATITGNGTLSGAATGPVRPYLQVVNRTGSLELLFVSRVRSSATDAQIQAVLKDPRTNSPATISYPTGFVSASGPHRVVTTRAAFSAGRYLVIAAALTSAGPPTVRAGQVRLLTLG